MYKYLDLKQKIFTEEGQVLFLGIRDNVHKLIGLSGVVRMQEAISGQSGDSWLMLACVDRLVELGEIKEIVYGDAPAQHRIFTK